MIAIHGLGYTGLTAAVHFAHVGQDVIGYDANPDVVDAINAGVPKAGDFLAYLGADVRTLVQKGRLRATTNFDDVARVNVHVIDVPTEKDGKPWTTLVKGVIRRLADRTPDPTLIIVESTVTPGTTDQLLAERGPFYDRVTQGSLNFSICPRRDWFADPHRNLATIPRIVGGLTERATRGAVNVLSRVSSEILTTDYRTAEVVKPLENSILAMPVVFAQQLAVELSDFNIAEALRLACTHWRFTSFGGLYLSFAMGGRCVPLGPQYLEEAVSNHGRVLRIGRDVIGENALFPSRIARIVVGAMRTHEDRVLVLGIGYRPEFKDAGSSPGLAVVTALRRHHITTGVHDHLWSVDEMADLVVADLVGGITSQPINGGLHIVRDTGVHGLEASIHRYDFILLATPHARYAALYETATWREGQVVLDAQGAWAHHRSHFKALGVRYVRVGEPGWTELKSV